MAKTYEELLAGATQIKNNELPESNTHSLVGGQLLDMVEKNKDDKDKSDKKFTELEEEKQDKLTFDNIPTIGSDNPVTSGGIREALNAQKSEVDTAKNEALQAIEENEQAAITNFNAQKITPEMLSESTKQFIEASGGGTITNLADGEDITSKENDLGVNVLKLADKRYDDVNFSGKGYKIIRKNIQDTQNILTQEMINEPNTIYEIRYDFDLNGNKIVIPDGCVLDFSKGGSFSNGNLAYNKTFVFNPRLINVNTTGSLINNEILYEYGNSTLNGLMSLYEGKSQIVDLQGKTMSAGGMHISRTSSLTIKNGTLLIPKHYSFDPAVSTFIMDNVRVEFSTEDELEYAFGGGISDKESDYPVLILRNCIFVNKNNTYILNAFYGRFAKVVVSYCTFIDCGMQVQTFKGSVSSWNYNSYVSFDHCIFNWDANKSYTPGSSGNRDGIACGTFDNIFVTNCTFNNLTNSCLDCYTASNIIFHGNKLVNCKQGVELKSLYRESDWTDGVGQGELPRNHGISITNNIVDNCETFISTFIGIQSDIEGDLSYFISKADKYKRNCLIANNIIYNTQTYDSSKYCIVGDPILDTLITGNVFYSESSKYFFYRDRYSTDLTPIEHFHPTVVITNCYFYLPEGAPLFASNRYPNYIIKNCVFNKQTTISVYGTEYNENNIVIDGCDNITLGSGSGGAPKSKIRVTNCKNLRISLSEQPAYVELDNCSGLEGTLVSYSNISSDHEVHTNIFIVSNSDGIIVSNKKINNMVLLDDNSYCRKGNSTAVNVNYKYIKPFETREELEELGIPLSNYTYYKYDATNNYKFKKYTFNPSINKWQNDQGITDTVNYSGTFENKPSKGDITIGFEYFCTDKQTTEGATNGIMIYHKGGDVWVDALGRVIS